VHRWTNFGFWSFNCKWIRKRWGNFLAFCATSNAWDAVYSYRCSLRLSISLSTTRLISASLYKNDWTDQDAVWDEHSWKPWNIVLDVGPDHPTERGRETQFLNFGTPPIFGTAEARDLKFCVHTEGWGPSRELCKSWPLGIGCGVPWLNSECCDLLLSPEWLKLGTWNFACKLSDEGLNKNCAKVAHGEWKRDHVT